MEQRKSEWLRTLVSVILGFSLATGWQAFRDSRTDARNLNVAVVLLKSRVSNDVYFTKAMIDGLRNGSMLLPFSYQSEPQPVDGLSLLLPSVIRDLDHYNRAVVNAKKCNDFGIAASGAGSGMQKRAKVITICLEAFVEVGENFLAELDQQYPDVKVTRKPSLGTSSHTVQVK